MTPSSLPPVAGEPVAVPPRGYEHAPEELWLQLHGDCSDDELDQPVDYQSDDVTWCWHEINKSDVRYVRADLTASKGEGVSRNNDLCVAHDLAHPCEECAKELSAELTASKVEGDSVRDALEALDSMDDYARMTVGVDAMGPREVLRKFILAKGEGVQSDDGALGENSGSVLSDPSSPSEGAKTRDAERERCARICESLAQLMMVGAGESYPGGRLWQVARMIRSGEEVPGWHEPSITEPVREDLARAKALLLASSTAAEAKEPNCPEFESAGVREALSDEVLRKLAWEFGISDGLPVKFARAVLATQGSTP